MKQFHARGKLLLSAEYMVMHGSQALAIPLKQGQSLEISTATNPDLLSWTATHKDKPWFTAELDFATELNFATELKQNTLKVRTTSNPEMAEKLRSLLEAGIELKPSFRESLRGKAALTRLDFNPDYGFGSSSSLIALVAMWAGIPPLDLHFKVSAGSGYDVACSVSEGPIIYQLKDLEPKYHPVQFKPPFKDQLWFAWLGNKQPTASHLARISGRISPGSETITSFSRYTKGMLKAESLNQFREIMEHHEEALSSHLGIRPVSERLRKLPGSVKSLGAWGGDFILIATEENEQNLRKQLEGYGIHTLFNYKQLAYEKIHN